MIAGAKWFEETWLAMRGRWHPIYVIPDGDGAWMNSSPTAHAAYLKEHDEKSRSKLRRAIRLIKWWANCRVPATPLRSFHAELLLASAGAAKGPRTYSEILLDALRELNLREGVDLRDPLGISGLVQATGTETQRRSLVRSVEYGRVHAEAAVYAEQRGRLTEAIRQWKIVFNDSFPS